MEDKRSKTYKRYTNTLGGVLMISNNLIIDKLQNLFSELSLVLVANRREDIDYHISEVKYVVKILNECKKIII